MTVFMTVLILKSHGRIFEECEQRVKYNVSFIHKQFLIIINNICY